MSSQNYFDLLGDDENEEPTTVIARATLPSPVEKTIPQKSQQSAAGATHNAIKASATYTVREEKQFEGSRGGRGGLRPGRVSRSTFNDRDLRSQELGMQRDNREGATRERGHHSDRNPVNVRENNEFSSHGPRGGHYTTGDNSLLTGGAVFGTGLVDAFPRVEGDIWSSDGSRGRGRGSRGRFRVVGGDSEERPRRREFDRRSGSGFGNEVKRDGYGRGNWGAEVEQRPSQDVVELNPKDEGEKGFVEDNKTADVENHAAPSVNPSDDVVEKKGGEEDNELTLDEYEKILEGKRKALQVSKAEERKVEADKEFESMQLVEKKVDGVVFIKLGSEKEKKKKEKEREAFEKEEKVKKTQNINEFLKPADGEKFHASAGSRGRGRNRGRVSETRGGSSDGERHATFGVRGNGSHGLSNARRVSAPRIEDPGQFPTLGGK